MMLICLRGEINYIDLIKYQIQGNCQAKPVLMRPLVKIKIFDDKISISDAHKANSDIIPQFP